MTISLTPVANSQTFGTWLQRTNDLVQLFSANSVTVDSSLGGSLSTGNAYVNGIFGSNTLYATYISGGNLTSNGLLTILTNTAVNATMSVGNSSMNVALGWLAGDLAIIEFYANQNNYSQAILTNSNNGVSSSGDFVVADNGGISSTNYIDMGINGSNWSNTQWTINGGSDGYLYTGNTNLSIGTAGQKYINFFANGTLATNEVMRITSGANVGIGNTNPNAKLQVTGTANVSGAVNLANTLNLTGAASLSNTLLVTGNTTLSNTLAVTGNTTLSNTLAVTGNTILSNTLSVTGNVTFSNVVSLSNVITAVTFSNTVTIIGTATLANTLAVTGNTSLSNTLTVTGNASFSNTIAVTGNVTFSNTLAVTGNTTFSNTLSVTGNVTFANTLAVTGNVTFSNGTIFNGNVVVNGNTTFNNLVSTNANVSVNGYMSVSNSLTIGGALNVSGNITYTGVSAGNLVPSDSTYWLGQPTQRWSLYGLTLNVSNTATFSNTLAVTGNTTLSNTLAVTGNVTFSNAIAVTGNATLSNTLVVTGAVTLSNTLAVTGNVTFSNTLNITGSANFVNAVANIVTSNTSVLSNLNYITTNSYSYASAANAQIDAFTTTSYRSAEYTIQVSNSSAYQVSKVLVVHDGTNAYATEYAIMNTAANMLTLGVTINAGSVIVYATPSDASVVVKFTRSALVP